MVERRNTTPGMVGKHVEIFLKTPLFRFRYKSGKVEKELMENAVRISGLVEEDRGSGLLVKVAVLSNMKETETDLPFQEIFLPLSKIDFVVVE